MNQETRMVLKCAARVRQVMTNITEKIEFSEVPRSVTGDSSTPLIAAIALINDILQELQAEGLYDRVYPLNPHEGEDLVLACRRVFGLRITNDIFEQGGWHAQPRR